MGEKFGVNPATGTGSLTVPLASSPGRSGFGPQLSLSYDSGSGNGPFGFGWSLSLPTITRKTDKGLPRYLDSEESDVFIVSGAEDLVPILDGAGKRFFLSRTVHRIAYRIHLYRPRIEGLFARIERWTRVDNGVSHWRTITRDNVTTIFGFDENSRIADPRDPRRIFSYLIHLTFDDKGNATHYQYAPEDSLGVNKSRAHEANRTDVGRNTQRYLKYIRYGNFQPFFPDWLPDGEETPLPAGWHFKIVFDYGDHRADAPMPTPDLAIDPAWPVRPDPFSAFRAGFEVRTYRRCERVLLFHNFPDEAEVGADCLVRSTDFRYSDELTPSDPRNPIYTFIESITQVGYRRAGARYEQRSTPPLEFFYSQPEIHPEILTFDDADSRENLPEGLDGTRFQWVDLDGEGLAGILTEQDGGWGYKRNLGPINQVMLPSGERVARARFGPLERIPSLPVPASLGGGQQLLDLTGEGRLDLVAFDATVPGFFARTADDDWETLKTFSSLPRLNWSEPNLKFVDLTGDGRADVLITEEDLYTFYPSLGIDGFGEAERVFTPWDEERGPRVVFADGTQTVSLADMSGDGMSDIVRVRNGEVCYWPNLGYGRFGARVAMDDAPRFADEESFDPRRIRFADVDGSGTTDLLYLGDDGVQVCFNRSGNSWAESHLLAVFPGADNLSGVQVADLLGNGTACLIWSSPLPAESYAPLRYVDLMGSRKPHLMVRARNNLGAETRLSYAPSTRFYLEDKRDGKPWITRLPFPVHVVERVEIYDWIGRSRFVTRYAYHHGYFDGEEREFRGFGMVEQWDTETHRDDTLFPDVETINENAASFVPPMLTRTWFHTGAFVEAGTVSRQYAHEYWVEPALRGAAPADVAAREAMLLPDTFLEPPPAPLPPLDPDEMREAYRALKGSPLRIEIYSEDETLRAEHPYTVTEQNFTVRRLQPRGPNRHAVFLTHPRESLSYQYERQPKDPRVTHDMTLEVDEFCNVRRSVSVGYGRRAGYPEPEPHLSGAFRTMLAHDQTRLHVSATEHIFTDPVNRPEQPTPFDSYRARLSAETITAELTGIAPAAALFRFDEMDGHFTTLWGGGNDIPYEDVSTPDIEGVGVPVGLGRRIVERSRTLYRSDDLTMLLPLRVIGSQALPGETYRLALTPGLITRIFGPARVTNAILFEGGYVRPPGEANWWIPSGRVFYSPGDADAPAQELAEARAHFYQPRRAVDPFGAVSRVTFDAFDLLPSVSTDALGNVTSADNDYRVLSPFRTTDPNNNWTEVAFDCLGRVTGTAVSGKAGEGDSLAGFDADLSEAEIQAVQVDLLAAPGAILGNATSRIIYDLFAYLRTRDLPTPEAPLVYTLTRETHVSDLADGESTRFDHLFTYSDGLGREAQRKAQAEPGPLPGHGDNVSPRWVGSGWTIYNNKGKPVRKYEPFFSDTHRFEFDRQAGVSSVLFYDPVDRVIATVRPDNTFEKTNFDAWRQETWDANDTVLISDPRTDADVGDFFRRLFGNAPGAFASWHDRRIAGTLGATPEERAANQDAAQKAAAHAATPAVKHTDSLGRTCLSVEDNGLDNGFPQRFATRTALDTESKPLSIFDAAGRRVMETCLREPLGGGGFRYVAGFDVAGNPLYRNGADGGERRTFHNILASPMRTWDARGFIFRIRYDALHRPIHRFVGRAGFGEILIERFVYGEKHPDAGRNLKGRVFRHYDGAGLAGNERYDFKGNMLESVRQIARHQPATQAASFYNTTPDWSAINNVADDPALDIAALDAATAPLLVAADSFIASGRFDAMNRAIQIVTPHRAGGRPSVIQPTYNDANLLERVDVWVRQAASPAALLDPTDPMTPPDVAAISSIAYNARGQREMIALGNGVITTFSHDAETFRLTTLTTTRPPPFPADARTVQALAYQYDPVGNITRLRDTADIQNVVYFRNQRVEPSADYGYDALYRLKAATGREHLGQTDNALPPPQQVTNDDSFRANPLARGDGNAMSNYTERYEYDPAGNLTHMIHEVASGGWTRHYSYVEPSRISLAEVGDRLSANSLPGDGVLGPYTARYAYDEHGNTTRMPHLPVMTWDEMDHLQSTTRQSANAVMPETTYYAYDAGGERLRKVTYASTLAGNTPRIKSERLYLGVFEIYREYDGAGVLTKERETLHVTDDQKRVAIIETRTIGLDPAPPQLVRYQFSNHLGSAALELDDAAAVISYEEYFPYGSTSYQAVRDQTETPKRYRYTGKERDEENDLYYHGARYYAPWLGRWTACDPIGAADNINLYVYVRNNPIGAKDPTGMLSWSQIGIITAVVAVAVVVTVVTAGAGGVAVAAASSAIGGTSLGAGGAAAATLVGTVAVGAGSGYASARAADATGQLLTRGSVDAAQNRTAGTAGLAAGAVTSLIPGVAQARSIVTAARSATAATTAVNATRAATTAVNATRSSSTAVRAAVASTATAPATSTAVGATTVGARAVRVGAVALRGAGRGAVGGATYETTRQHASGEHAQQGGFDTSRILTSTYAGAGLGAGTSLLGAAALRPNWWGRGAENDANWLGLGVRGQVLYELGSMARTRAAFDSVAHLTPVERGAQALSQAVGGAPGALVPRFGQLPSIWASGPTPALRIFGAQGIDAATRIAPAVSSPQLTGSTAASR
ncbi:MAG TPA: SpvB/TcaC N-terminal domain-containing protein [Pyrinomonadaceae bacterium]|jgi:RHS repeat-associated protein